MRQRDEDRRREKDRRPAPPPQPTAPTSSAHCTGPLPPLVIEGHRREPPAPPLSTMTHPACLCEVAGPPAQIRAPMGPRLARCFRLAPCKSSGFHGKWSDLQTDIVIQSCPIQCQFAKETLKNNEKISLLSTPTTSGCQGSGREREGGLLDGQGDDQLADERNCEEARPCLPGKPALERETLPTNSGCWRQKLWMRGGGDRRLIPRQTPAKLTRQSSASSSASHPLWLRASRATWASTRTRKRTETMTWRLRCT